MHQILLIFRKDLRRFYPEILFALLTLVCFVAFYPYTWRPHDEIPTGLFGLSIAHDTLGALPGLFIAIIPVSWLVFIGRTVQDESLVGDRQYWVTRPIAWPLLLAEKALLCVLFLIVPFFVAQLAILYRAGLPVLSNAPRVLLLILVDISFFMLPLFVLATLTRNFFRLSMTILGIFAAFLVVFFAFGGDSAPNTFLPYNDPVSLPLFVITCATVIIMQYASRTVWLARGLLALSMSIVLVIAINPLEGRLLESTFYPLAAPNTLPVTLAIESTESRKISVSTTGKHPSITLPVAVSGVPYGKQFAPEDARLVVESANGTIHTSAWQAIYNRRYLDTTRYGVIDLQLDKPILEQLKSGPVTLRLQLALAYYDLGDPARIPVPAATEVSIPGLGLCAIDANRSLEPGVLCRVPLRQPPLFQLSAPWTSEPCAGPDSRAQRQEAILTSNPGSTNPTPIDVSLTSVITSATSFSLPASTDTNLRELPPVTLCPGTSLTITPLRLNRRARVELVLPDYTMPPSPHP